MAAALTELLGEGTVSGAPAGLHLVVRLPSEVRGVDVARRAGAAGTPVVPISRYQVAAPGSGDDAVVLGFGNLRSGREQPAAEAVAAAVRGR